MTSLIMAFQLQLGSIYLVADGAADLFVGGVMEPLAKVGLNHLGEVFDMGGFCEQLLLQLELVALGDLI
jgi:hypothetical protein